MDWNKENIVTTKSIVTYASIIFVLGGLILFSVMWIAGIFGTAEDREAMKKYNEERKKYEKIIQSSLAEAEKYREQAEAQRKINDELAAKLSERDKKRDSDILVNDERRKQENEKILNEYNDDINRVNNMPDSERPADICSRLDRLSKDNPALEQFRCVNGVPNN